jgi:4-hydroxy-4-methyl-2-oxoglutarate aldolase
MVRLTILLLLCVAPVLEAQMGSFTVADRIKYTKTNPYGRFPDGRPKVPDEVIRRLANASSEDAWRILTDARYVNQFTGGWQIVHPEKTLVGRAFTAQFMPLRSDVNDPIEADAKAAGLASATTQRVIDLLQPGDVLVVDVFGKIEGGDFAGVNLATAIMVATGNGYVVNGSIRDLPATVALNIPIFMRGTHPGVRTNTMLTGINVPVQIGGVTVMPGDIVLGDAEGLTFIPPHLVEKVADHAEETELHDQWTEEKIRTGKFKASEIYPSPKDPALKKEYAEWLARKKAERKSRQ